MAVTLTSPAGRRKGLPESVTSEVSVRLRVRVRSKPGFASAGSGPSGASVPAAAASISGCTIARRSIRVSISLLAASSVALSCQPPTPLLNAAPPCAVTVRLLRPSGSPSVRSTPSSSALPPGGTSTTLFRPDSERLSLRRTCPLSENEPLRAPSPIPVDQLAVALSSRVSDTSERKSAGSGSPGTAETVPASWRMPRSRSVSIELSFDRTLRLSRRGPLIVSSEASASVSEKPPREGWAYSRSIVRLAKFSLRMKFTTRWLAG